MKKLKPTIPNGGSPLGAYPILREIFDDESKDAIEAILNALIDPQTEGVVLSGCIASGLSPNISVTEGYIYVDGEVLRYPGETGLTTPFYLKKDTVMEEGGVFADTVFRNYIDVHTAISFTTIGGGSGTQYIDFDVFSLVGRTLIDVIQELGTELFATSSVRGSIELATLTEVTAGTDTQRAVVPDTLANRGHYNSWTQMASVTVDPGYTVDETNAFYRVTDFGKIELGGFITVSQTSPSVPALTDIANIATVSARPDRPIAFIYDDDDQDRLREGIIGTSGDLNISEIGNGNSITVRLDSVVYYPIAPS